MKINELRGECAKKNITQKDIAKKINKTEQTVSKIFNNQADLRLSEAKEICDMLNLNNEKRGYIFLN